MSQVNLNISSGSAGLGFISQPGSSADVSQISELHLTEVLPSDLDYLSPSGRGWINEHFARAIIDGKKMRICLAEGCGKHYAASNSHDTFKGHWTKEHGTITTIRRTRFMFHDDLHTNRLIKLVIAGRLCHSVVDLTEFKLFAEAMNPNKHIICRQTLSEIMNRNKVKLTNLVSDKLENAVSVALTFDIWSVRKGARGFGCVTAHYISTLGIMENLILHFERMVFPHDAETIRDFLQTPIEIYNLRGKIAAITTDNASNNIAAIKMFENSFGLNLINSGLIHYKCVAHIIDLGMKDAMKQLKESIGPVREAVMAIRSSRKRKEIFFDKQKELIHLGELTNKQPLELAEDVDHRWNSAFILLERAYLLRKAINFMITSVKALQSLQPIDWTLIEGILTFLKPFHEATLCLCKANDVTISAVSYITPQLVDHCSKYSGNMNAFIAAAATSLQDKLTDYALQIYHPVVDIAYFLDPRYKTKNMSDDHRKLVLDRLRLIMDELPQPAAEPAETSTFFNDSEIDEPIDELAVYCEGRRVKATTNVIMWWINNSEMYPKLSAIARMVLPIQATSVASERVFSMAGEVDTKGRNRLSDESVANIVLFKSWMNFLNIE